MTFDLKKKGSIDELAKIEKKLVVDFANNKLELAIRHIDGPNPFYTLIYDDGFLKNRPLYNLRIDFIDPISQTVNGNAYISNIHRSSPGSKVQLNGSQMVELAIAICKRFGVKKVSLYDGTRIICSDGSSADLSLIKLLEKDMTFYMRFGFQLNQNSPGIDNGYFLKNPNKTLSQLLIAFRKLKTNDIINKLAKAIDLIISSIKKGESDKIELVSVNFTVNDYIFYKTNEHPHKMLYTFIEILEILVRNKKPLFVDILLSLAKDNCAELNKVLYGFIGQHIYIVNYGKNGIRLDFTELLYILHNMRQQFIYTLDLTNK